jgi:hypothetical protein
MQASQENGNTLLGGPAGGYYLADQWVARWSVSPGVCNASRSQSPTPNGSPNIANTSVSTAKAVLATNDYFVLTTKLEGQRVADFQWGTVLAKQMVVRFWMLATVPGLYSFRIANGAEDRSFATQFSIVGNSVWNMISAVIPGCTDGTWLKDAGIGINFDVVYGIGSTWTGTAGSWQTTPNTYAGPGQTNGVATASTGFYVGDVGIYLDPYKTGVAPRFEIPEPTAEVRRCQRYWYKGFQFHGILNAANGNRGGSRHPVPMRATPVGAPVGSPRLYDLGGTPIITSLSTACNAMAADFQLTCAAGGLVAGRPAANYYQSPNDYIAMNARL